MIVRPGEDLRHRPTPCLVAGRVSTVKHGHDLQLRGEPQPPGLIGAFPAASSKRLGTLESTTAAPYRVGWRMTMTMNKIDPTATVHSTARVDPSATVRAGVMIGSRTALGARVIIGANVRVGNRARLEQGVRIPGNAVVPPRGRAVA